MLRDRLFERFLRRRPTQRNARTDRTHGLQFKADFLKTTPPTTAEGIEKYLGSGMVRGIGPVLAKRIVGAFGEGTFEIIEASPEKLREVPYDREVFNGARARQARRPDRKRARRRL